MFDVNGSVLGVGTHQTRTNRTIYDVNFSDGRTYTTFEAPVAQRAQQYLNQQVTLRVEQNGNYFNLKDIAGPGQTLPPLAMPTAPIVIPQNEGRGGMSPERESRIVKQSLLATSFNFMGMIYGGTSEVKPATEQALELAKRLYVEVMSPKETPAPSTPTGVAAFVNEQTTAPPVTVGTPAAEQPNSGMVKW